MGRTDRRTKERRNSLWPVCAVTAALLLTAILLRASPRGLLTAGAGAQEPILVIDAGHGGEDGGAVAPDGTLESDLNLDIALRLNALAVFFGIDTVMTRTEKEISYPVDADTLSARKKADQNERIALINAIPEAILISIHQNNYPAPAPWGIQVFYGEQENSDAFAAILQNSLTELLCPDNRRMAEPIDEGIYLMRKANCRAVLVECGFLSNPEELERLKTESYRTQLAVIMLASYTQFIRGIST